MIRPLAIRWRGESLDPRAFDALLERARGAGPVEIEIGFGKGRYLLARAAACPGTTFVGIESATLYWRDTTRRAERRGLGNVVTVCGDALYVLATAAVREIASAIHVYFPDPWPKLRHRRRRLLDPSTVDLVVGALAPGAPLFFATDHAEYGAAVEDVLRGYPAVSVERVEGPWPGGARTNYEIKYEGEGRPILRLVVTRRAPARAPLLHPDGRCEVAAGAIERGSGPSPGEEHAPEEEQALGQEHALQEERMPDED